MSTRLPAGAVPPLNLYFLLCYAWDLVPPRARSFAAPLDLPADAAPTLALLATLFGRAWRQYDRHARRQQYTTVDQPVRQPRGRILLPVAARNPRWATAPVLPCRFTVPTVDSPLHRLVATAARQLLQYEELPRPLRTLVRQVLPMGQMLPDVREPDVPLYVQLAEAQLAAGDLTSRLLLRTAELLLRNRLPVASAASGRQQFYDFTFDEGQMGRLFETFTRNFLRREQTAANVASEVLRWRGATATQPAALPLLPVMRTDITLTTPARRLVIDTKYYARPLAGSRFAAEKLLAPHLYQLLAYLRNQPSAPGQVVEGLLLYGWPAPDGWQLEYQLEGFRLRVCTLGLAQPWEQISHDLLTLVAD